MRFLPSDIQGLRKHPAPRDPRTCHIVSRLATRRAQASRARSPSNLRQPHRRLRGRGGFSGARETSGVTLMRAKLLADAVHKQLHPSTAGADVDVEMLPLHKQLAKFSQEKQSCSGPLVELLGAHVLNLFRNAGTASGCCSIQTSPDRVMPLNSLLPTLPGRHAPHLTPPYLTRKHGKPECQEGPATKVTEPSRQTPLATSEGCRPTRRIPDTTCSAARAHQVPASGIRRQG